MHDIEPHYRWRDEYIAAEDQHSPFFGRQYSEFSFSNKVYNYYIHPQWDEFGSSSLYLKVIMADYDKEYAIIEMIGEWNDCLHNDIMHLKREVIDTMVRQGIHKYIFICENVLNFHGDHDDDYYEEWYQEVSEEDGWICFLNTLDHVEDEMQETRLQSYIHFGEQFNGVNWRPHKPRIVFQLIDALVNNRIHELPGRF